MSRAEIGAGREMDALIAERVMKIAPRAWDEGTLCPKCGDEMRWCGERSRCTTCVEWRYSPYREYSTDIVAAWRVVEKLGELGFDVVIEWKGPHREYANTAEVSVRKGIHTSGHGLGTMPEAVCSAALMALATVEAA